MHHIWEGKKCTSIKWCWWTAARPGTARFRCAVDITCPDAPIEMSVRAVMNDRGKLTPLKNAWDPADQIRAEAAGKLHFIHWGRSTPPDPIPPLASDERLKSNWTSTFLEGRFLLPGARKRYPSKSEGCFMTILPGLPLSDCVVVHEGMR